MASPAASGRLTQHYISLCWCEVMLQQKPGTLFSCKQAEGLEGAWFKCLVHDHHKALVIDPKPQLPEHARLYAS